MSNTHKEALREQFYEEAEYNYNIAFIDSDGDELGGIDGETYEELLEQNMPTFSRPGVYELTATVNGHEVPAKRTSFTEVGCLEKFQQVEDAAIEFAEELFEESIADDHDSSLKDVVEERML